MPTVNQHCAYCGAQLSEGANFCLQCGSAVVAAIGQCARCGAELPKGASFCIRCGQATGTTPEMPTSKENVSGPRLATVEETSATSGGSSATEPRVSSSVASNAEEQGSVWDAFKQIFTGFGYVYVVLVVFTTGVQAALGELFFLEETKTLWTVFTATLPLTGAFTIIGLLFLNEVGKVLEGRPSELHNPWGWMWVSGVIAAGAIVLSNLLSNLLGGRGIDFVCVHFTGAMVFLCPFESFFYIYGFKLFASSIVLGFFLAWAGRRIIRAVE